MINHIQHQKLTNNEVTQKKVKRVSVFLFLISSIFLLTNFLSLNDLDKTLKELKNE